MSFRRRRKVVPARTEGELDAMQAAGEIVGRALLACRDAAKPGVTTADLNEIAHQVIIDAGATPSFLGYEGFPASVCASVNEVIVHGIPSSSTVLADGDLVSIDCGAILDGWHGDSALTFGVGKLSDDVEKLNIATSEVLAEGIKAMVPGARLTDISYALEMATRGLNCATILNSASSMDTAGTALGARCTWIPSFPTKAKQERDPASSKAPYWPLNRCSFSAASGVVMSLTTAGRSSAPIECRPPIGSTQLPPQRTAPVF